MTSVKMQNSHFHSIFPWSILRVVVQYKAYNIDWPYRHSSSAFLWAINVLGNSQFCIIDSFCIQGNLEINMGSAGPATGSSILFPPLSKLKPLLEDTSIEVGSRVFLNFNMGDFDHPIYGKATGLGGNIDVLLPHG